MNWQMAPIKLIIEVSAIYLVDASYQLPRYVVYILHLPYSIN